jgi:hypothetical protein
MVNHFKKSGWIYQPVSIAGWIFTIVYAALCIVTLISIDKNYNSLVNSLIRFFPYFISFTVVWFWVASNCSGNKD